MGTNLNVCSTMAAARSAAMLTRAYSIAGLRKLCSRRPGTSFLSRADNHGDPGKPNFGTNHTAAGTKHTRINVPR